MKNPRRLFRCDRYGDSVHFWIGPFGLHLFRDPFEWCFDTAWQWRQEET